MSVVLLIVGLSLLSALVLWPMLAPHSWHSMALPYPEVIDPVIVQTELEHPSIYPEWRGLL